MKAWAGRRRRYAAHAARWFESGDVARLCVTAASGRASKPPIRLQRQGKNFNNRVRVLICVQVLSTSNKRQSSPCGHYLEPSVSESVTALR